MKEGKKRIEFRIVSPQAEKVYLCGSFNNWSESSDPMKKAGAGTWKKTKMLSVGTHEYKFIFDGEWTLDPNALTQPERARNGKQYPSTIGRFIQDMDA